MIYQEDEIRESEGGLKYKRDSDGKIWCQTFHGWKEVKEISWFDILLITKVVDRP